MVVPLAAAFTIFLGYDIVRSDWPALGSDLSLLFGGVLILFGAAHVLLLSWRLAGVAAASAVLTFVWAAGVLATAGVPMHPPVLAALLAMCAVGASFWSCNSFTLRSPTSARAKAW